MERIPLPKFHRATRASIMWLAGISLIIMGQGSQRPTRGGEHRIYSSVSSLLPVMDGPITPHCYIEGRRQRLAAHRCNASESAPLRQLLSRVRGGYGQHYSANVKSGIGMSWPTPNGVVLLTTNMGLIEIKLFSNEAPIACKNFVQLVMEGYYDGCPIHRVVPGHAVEMGDPTGTGVTTTVWGKPLPKELNDRLTFRIRGIVAMTDRGSQFFITLDEAEEYNGETTIFGLVRGETLYTVIDNIGNVPVNNASEPLDDVRIIRAEVLENPFKNMKPRPPEQRPQIKKRQQRQGSSLSSSSSSDDDDDLGRLNARVALEAKSQPPLPMGYDDMEGMERLVESRSQQQPPSAESLPEVVGLSGNVSQLVQHHHPPDKGKEGGDGKYALREDDIDPFENYEDLKIPDKQLMPKSLGEDLSPIERLVHQKYPAEREKMIGELKDVKSAYEAAKAQARLEGQDLDEIDRANLTYLDPAYEQPGGEQHQPTRIGKMKDGEGEARKGKSTQEFSKLTIAQMRKELANNPIYQRETAEIKRRMDEAPPSNTEEYENQLVDEFAEDCARASKFDPHFFDRKNTEKVVRLPPPEAYIVPGFESLPEDDGLVKLQKHLHRRPTTGDGMDPEMDKHGILLPPV